MPSVPLYWEIYGLGFDILKPQREIVKIYPRAEVISRISQLEMDKIIASHDVASKHFATEPVDGSSDGRYLVTGRTFYAGAFFNAVAMIAVSKKAPANGVVIDVAA